jgi:MFS family permease
MLYPPDVEAPHQAEARREHWRGIGMVSAMIAIVIAGAVTGAYGGREGAWIALVLTCLTILLILLLLTTRTAANPPRISDEKEVKRLRELAEIPDGKEIIRRMQQIDARCMEHDHRRGEFRGRLCVLIGAFFGSMAWLLVAGALMCSFDREIHLSGRGNAGVAALTILGLAVLLLPVGITLVLLKQGEEE